MLLMRACRAKCSLVEFCRRKSLEFSHVISHTPTLVNHLMSLSIQVASDLHLEHLWRALPGEIPISHVPGAEVLVLAGDIANGYRAIDVFADWPVDVIYILGNHEHYLQGDMMDNVESIRAAAAGTKVHILERDAIVIKGVRFLGCTMWTDYELNGAASRQKAMEAAIGMIADHRTISLNGAIFRPYHALGEHVTSRAWLENELQRELGEGGSGEEWSKTVVITHHAPHPGSVHPQYAGNPLNAAFASDLHELVAQADLWIHGHTHNSFDYEVGGCRVVANPRGYPLNLRATPETLDDVVFENSKFDSQLAIEV